MNQNDATGASGVTGPDPDVNKTTVLSFAHLSELSNGGWRGTFQVAQRQTPLRGEGLGKLGRCLPAKAGIGTSCVAVFASDGQRAACIVQRLQQGLV